MKLKEAVCVLEHLAAEFHGAEYITNAIYKVLDKLDDRKDYMEVLNACLDFQAEEIEELSDSNINLQRKLISQNLNDRLTTANLDLVAENAELKKRYDAVCDANRVLSSRARQVGDNYKILSDSHDRLFNQAIELAKERNELLETCKGRNS